MYRFVNQRRSSHAREGSSVYNRPTSPTKFNIGTFNLSLEHKGLQLLSMHDDPSIIERLCMVRQGNPCKRVQQTELFDLEAWEDKPWTLMYKAHITKDYDRGDYYVLLKDDQAVAGAGFYIYPDTIHQVGPKPFSIVMSRFYTRPDMRVQWFGSHILRAQIQAMQTEQGVLTFNEINSALYGKIARLEPRWAYLDLDLEWPIEWRSFKALGQLHINATDQFCLVTTKSQHHA